MFIRPQFQLSFFRLFSNRRIVFYRQSCNILGVSLNDDQNTVRKAYIELVKKLHPDSGTEEANAEKFQTVDNAFKILQERFAKLRRGIDDEEVSVDETPDIKHTAPQHRQYLSFDGVGFGTPFERQKQYQQLRAVKAAERVADHRIQKAQASENALISKQDKQTEKHGIKTKYGFERIVEDLIQEAIAKGDFEKLSGFGKPLSSEQTQNPYVDFTTHKLNKILIDNGFCPEWITLQKEIREARAKLILNLYGERSILGPLPFSNSDHQQWEIIVKKYHGDVLILNKKIDKFNLLVPVLNKQMLRIQLDTILNDALSKSLTNQNSKKFKNSNQIDNNQSNQSHEKNLFSFINIFF